MTNEMVKLVEQDTVDNGIQEMIQSSSEG